MGPIIAVLVGLAGASEPECFDAWQRVEARVEATVRPSSPALRFDFRYGVTGGKAWVVLGAIGEDGVAVPSDGPLSPARNSGSWVELRDAQDRVLHTQGVHALVSGSVEGPGDGGTLVNVVRCPESGALRLSGFPNRADAAWVVWMQPPVDGVATGKTVELARFALPR